MGHLLRIQARVFSGRRGAWRRLRVALDDQPGEGAVRYCTCGSTGTVVIVAVRTAIAPRCA